MNEYMPTSVKPYWCQYNYSNHYWEVHFKGNLINTWMHEQTARSEVDRKNDEFFHQGEMPTGIDKTILPELDQLILTKQDPQMNELALLTATGKDCEAMVTKLRADVAKIVKAVIYSSYNIAGLTKLPRGYEIALGGSSTLRNKGGTLSQTGNGPFAAMHELAHDVADGWLTEVQVEIEKVTKAWADIDAVLEKV